MTPPEALARRYLWRIVAHVMPGAVIVDRSARDGGLGRDGTLYVVADRARPLVLPGITVFPRPGAPALPGDMSLPDGIHIAGEARSLLENLTPSRRTAAGTRRTLTRVEVEEWVDALLASRGVEGVNRLRDQARQLAPALQREKELAALEVMVPRWPRTRPPPWPRLHCGHVRRVSRTTRTGSRRSRAWPGRWGPSLQTSCRCCRPIRVGGRCSRSTRPTSPTTSKAPSSPWTRPPTSS
ncbi:MAG: hypothetical protein V9G12_01565 [Microthrixaceae bacterium]